MYGFRDQRVEEMKGQENHLQTTAESGASGMRGREYTSIGERQNSNQVIPPSLS